MTESNKLALRIIVTNTDMQKSRHIRQVVFVEEQQVDPKIEYDEFEDVATHVIAYHQNDAVGTARWRLTEKGYKLERFAVLRSARGLGVGFALVRFVMDQLDRTQTIYLNSQESALGFYAKLGFVAQGDRFYEANIPHFKMTYDSSLYKGS